MTANNSDISKSITPTEVLRIHVSITAREKVIKGKK